MSCPPFPVSDLRLDQELWYKVRVLVYDLSKPNDKACAARMLQTTDIHHISAPYFSPQEAEKIKLALTDEGGTTLETALATAFSDFFSKRKSLRDFRPCGPHDMMPVYLSTFGIKKSEMKEGDFVARVRRDGLGACKK